MVQSENGLKKCHFFDRKISTMEDKDFVRRPPIEKVKYLTGLFFFLTGVWASCQNPYCQNPYFSVKKTGTF